MMTSLRRTARGALTAFTAAAFIVLPGPAQAHEEDDHGCARYALVSCQADGDDSYECFEARYNACLDYFHGSASIQYLDRPDWLSA